MASTNPSIANITLPSDVVQHPPIPSCIHPATPKSQKDNILEAVGEMLEHTKTQYTYEEMINAMKCCCLAAWCRTKESRVGTPTAINQLSAVQETINMGQTAMIDIQAALTAMSSKIKKITEGLPCQQQVVERLTEAHDLLYNFVKSDIVGQLLSVVIIISENDGQIPRQ
ncbi:hypothetical protein P691DRAFT_784124 [Macrolepiota fuliginosa MF-IS2]|uniref:Uncharacterized protein n=1 Tax=Macrolepiota fuliginosa MF-IS2 TaxID=1400762 RepID=A0A9P5WW53_9AGAR|nr:hypothetical protein P691DRAFT_784124 [Macrolepiota fuliginosa MF-IS2]